MFVVASGSDANIDKEDVGSGFNECELINGFKPWIRKGQSNADNAWCTFCRCEIGARRSDLNSHYASSKHQRNAVPCMLRGSMVTC